MTKSRNCLLRCGIIWSFPAALGILCLQDSGMNYWLISGRLRQGIGDWGISSISYFERS
jgi:hypothetical protein